MSSIKEVRRLMKANMDLRRMMIRGNRNEILFDIDGDGQPDIAFQDINNDGIIDRLAFDVTGEGYFDLFLDDTDGNGIPDHIFAFIDGGEEEMDRVEEIAAGPEVEEAITEGVKKLIALLELKEIVREELDARLAALEKDVRRVRRELR